VVVTGAWPGGTLEFDIWPLARPSSLAVLGWLREAGIKRELAIREELQPPDNPNHLHVRLDSGRGWRPLRTGKFNDVFYDTGRRLATRYRLWWSVPGDLPVRPRHRGDPG